MRTWALLLLPALGCGSASGNSAAGAAALTSLAAASSVASRRAGGCYAQCTHGTICNRATGMCEPNPCGGQCAGGQVCDPVTDTCAAPRPSVPVAVIGFLANSLFWWPFGPYVGLWNPYYWAPGQNPYTTGPPPTRPPTVAPTPSLRDP